MLLSCSIICTTYIKNRCGVFDGDRFSPVLFCITVIALTIQPNKTGYGYKKLATS